MEAEIVLRCPVRSCRKAPTKEHFQDSATCAAAVGTLNGRVNVGKRRMVGKSSGRPPVIRKCERCGLSAGAREMRKHKCGALDGAV